MRNHPIIPFIPKGVGFFQKRICRWAGLLVLGGGCIVQPDIQFTYSQSLPEEVLVQARRIQESPRAFLHETLERCRSARTYLVEFHRQERVGILGELRTMERSRVTFRDEPLSVRMELLDESNDFRESVYVEGGNQNLMRVQWRRALLPGAEPPINDYDPNFAVLFGRSLNPITEFGVARLLARIVDAAEQATARQLSPEIEYLGIADLALVWPELGSTTGRAVHHIQLRYDEKTGYANRKVDLLIDADTLLPAACYLWKNDEILNARYGYKAYELNPPLDDEDFRIGGRSGG